METYIGALTGKRGVDGPSPHLDLMQIIQPKEVVQRPFAYLRYEQRHVDVRHHAARAVGGPCGGALLQQRRQHSLGPCRQARHGSEVARHGLLE